MNGTTKGKRPAVARRQGRLAKASAGINAAGVPRLPFERDESAASQGGRKRKIMLQAAADIKRGLKDTDRGEESNRTYQKLK